MWPFKVRRRSGRTEILARIETTLVGVRRKAVSVYYVNTCRYTSVIEDPANSQRRLHLRLSIIVNNINFIVKVLPFLVFGADVNKLPS